MDSCPVLIAGEWRTLNGDAATPVFNPSTGEVIAESPGGSAALVDEAVSVAAAAFPAWRDTPAVERARGMFRYRQLIEDNFERLCQSVTREHGKTLVEARGSVYRGLENVEYACGIPSLLMGDTLEDIARGVDCETMNQPLGVCVGITPFNFPAMVPLWMFPLALACGNTFVLKPSEKVPLTAVMLVELLEKAGLPKGVLNLVQGGREVVDALITHNDVRAISFVGSTPVARHIYETGMRHGKRVQANGGAKNYVVVMPDADQPKTVESLMAAAFGCAGERCMAGSTAIAVAEAGHRVLTSLTAAAKGLKVGRTDVASHQPDMGPLITAQHKSRVEELIASGEKDGAKVLCDGRGLAVDGAPNGFYLGATILDYVDSGMTIANEEVFGPVLNVMRVDSLDNAIELANRSAYGNGAAIFTQSGHAAREFKHRVKAGMVGVNVGVPATMAMFPFSGWGESFFGDLHIQGKEGVQFYTQQKVVSTRWFGGNAGDVWRK
ncbi:CoA-acylating methylmalonate-semialdehyde dehydrogenase [Phragmitibacter flavus]|uniref:methylmalonate-semialdehyde dehydrogenase (CoA acylating) n=1 Tax=Phragmitibacter flavus TaxID=2576071 RepID=A0A5R8K724_9BACT|nr:CoA-acylating methylmalonate-semialdehyde dehydrogenase [Phragmitibacter flavus]TLD68171.1 CoA-acylating methylmalonate-semialdehyde dehydrogenase [Phragmitibacter flavus]